MYKKNKSEVGGIIFTTLILITLVVITNNDNGKSFIENMNSKLVTPIQNGIVHLKNKANGNSEFFANIETLKSENEELKEKNSQLEQELREFENIKTQNETLIDYLELTEKYSEYTTIPGYIINKDISNYSKTIVINIGSDDGVEPNLAVIADQGLVGYVVSVTNNTAQVKTIIDSSSSISAFMNTSSETIVCKGILEDGLIKAMYIPTDANVVQGDSIKTSGIGGIYPKGIHIGTIKDVVSTKNIVDRYAEVIPAVDFENLNNILVIKND